MLIKINALTVPADSGDEIAHRFAARAGSVDGQPGFLGFELLKPIDGREQWLVVTRWTDEESYESWRTSPAFGHGHGGQPGSVEDSSGATPVAGEDTGHGTHPPAGHGGPAGPPTDEDGDLDSGSRPVAGEDTGHGTHPPAGAGTSDSAAERPPVSVASELWTYEVAVTNTAAGHP